MGHTQACIKCKKVQRWSSDLIIGTYYQEIFLIKCQYKKCGYINVIRFK